MVDNKFPRKVFLHLVRNTLFVRYAERKRGCRYDAGQFDMKYSTLEDVLRWIDTKPAIYISAEDRKI